MDKLWISVDISLMPFDIIISGLVNTCGHVWATINGHLDVIDEAVDTYGHVWTTINGSMDT